MKNILSLAVGLMLILSFGFVSVNALSCSDVTFDYSPSNLEANSAFSLRIANNNPPAPDDAWGDFVSANLTLSSGLSTTSSLDVDLTPSIVSTPYSWTNIVANSTGSFTSTVTLTNATGSCSINQNLNVGPVTNPNLTLSSTLSNSTPVINSPYTLTVNVSNTGNENATSIVITVSAGGNSTITPSSRSISNLQNGSSENVTFTINSPSSGTNIQITTTATYKDTSSVSMTDSTTSTTVNVSGHPFTANQSKVIDVQAIASAILTITTNTTTDLTEFTISNSSSNSVSAPSGKLAAGRYLTVTLPSSFSSTLETTYLKIYYQQSEISSNNINENSLEVRKLVSGNWGSPLTVISRDITNNFIEVSTSGFSTFGLFGDTNPSSSNNNQNSGSGNTNSGTTSSGTTLAKQCAEADYSCSSWTACTSGSQTRTCSKKTGVSCTGDATPVTAQTCSLTCTPDWECTDWSVCSSSGSQTRSCSDRKGCGVSSGKPHESQTCGAPKSEVISFDGGLTGFLVSPPILQYKASEGASTVFKVDNSDHTLTVKQVKSDSVILVIQSDPVEIEVKAGESKSVNIDADPENDITVRINSIENGVVLLTVDKVSNTNTETGIGVIVIVLVAVIGFYLTKRKKETWKFETKQAK